MMGYPKERKDAILRKLLPPSSRSVQDVAEEEGVSSATLYIWRKQARAEGTLMPDSDSTPAGWSARDKFAGVVETAALNQAELSVYCRERGLYPEQIAQWRAACEQANDWSAREGQRRSDDSRESKKRLKELERELRRKNAALAETAALLTLSKKARAIWGEAEDA